MRKASTLLPETSFWNIIQSSLKDGSSMEHQDDYLYAALEKLSVEELIGFKYWMIKFEVMAYTKNLWSAAYLIKGGCSDDGFEYFRYWIISRGEQVYKAALANADSLASEYPKVDADLDYEYEGLANIPLEVLDEKYEVDYYEIDGTYDFGEIYDYPELEFDWHEEEVRSLLPNTFALRDRLEGE